MRLLAALLKHSAGDGVAALVAYASGPKPKESAVPENEETPAYVVAILTRWKQLGEDEPSTVAD